MEISQIQPHTEYKRINIDIDTYNLIISLQDVLNKEIRGINLDTIINVLVSEELKKKRLIKGSVNEVKQ